MIRTVIFFLLALTAHSAPTEEKNNEIELNAQNLNNDLILRAKPIEQEVTLRIYTNDSPNTWFNLTTTNGNKAPINTAYSIQVIIHGWNNNGDTDWVLEMKNKFLTSGNYNTIVVDWGDLANKLYSTSADDTKPVGEYVGKVISSLVQSKQHNLQNVHLIGHSLGAHVAGIAGQNIQTLLGQKVGRITGLDPAAPLFEDPSLVAKDVRLDDGDAAFVDIIHTAGGGLVAIGFRHSLGHVDFYPNGGSGQNGCVTLQFCDHQRSHIYFTESISSKGFISTKCSSWNDFENSKCTGNQQEIMGLFVSLQARGDFYLATNSKTPFALGHAL